MSRSDSDPGSSLPHASAQTAPDAIARETDERQREPLWSVAIGCLLLVGAGLLFTSPPVISSGGGRSRRRRRSSPPEAPPEPNVPEESDEPHREPRWLIAFTFVVVIVIGLLLVFYAHLPPFLG